jgi:prephenate dehydratase
MDIVSVPTVRPGACLSRSGWHFRESRAPSARRAFFRAFAAPQAVAMPTWRAVFEAVNDGSVDAGVVPIERSKGGSVREIYDLLFNFDELRIVAEVTVPVHLALLAMPGQTTRPDRAHIQHRPGPGPGRRVSAVAAVAGHDQLQHRRRRQVDRRQGRDGRGAMASARVAPLYGLEVLATDIQTGDANRTRFAVVARDPIPDDLFGPSVLAGPMKTTLVWAVRNVPGSLHRCLGCFADRKINLSRLESRPSRGVRWEYVFWADMDADPSAPDCAAALAALLREAVMVRVAGVYHRAED